MSGESLRAQPLGQNIHASYLDTSVLRSDKELTGYWWDHEMGNSYNFSHLEDMEVALSSRESWYNSLIDEV